jgi:hypothetical protein
VEGKGDGDDRSERSWDVTLADGSMGLHGGVASGVEMRAVTPGHGGGGGGGGSLGGRGMSYNQHSSTSEPVFVAMLQQLSFDSKYRSLYGARFPTGIYTRGCYRIPCIFA